MPYLIGKNAKIMFNGQPLQTTAADIVQDPKAFSLHIEIKSKNKNRKALFRLMMQLKQPKIFKK